MSSMCLDARNVKRVIVGPQDTLVVVATSGNHQGARDVVDALMAPRNAIKDSWGGI